MNELQKIESFRKDLAIVETIEEVKLHETTANAMAVFAKANKISTDKQNELGRFRIEIECKKGGILNKEFPKSVNINSRSNNSTCSLRDAGITKYESSRARAILKCEKLPEYMDVIEQAGNVITPNGVDEIIKKIKKIERLKDRKKEYNTRIEGKVDNEFKIDIFKTTETFRIIYADPAWSYNDKQDTPMLGGAAKHYDTMSVSQLNELPLNKISEKDSVLFLWVTSPLLEDAFKVVNSWGFKYKTSFIWDKVKHNMGHYNSVRHEILLVCTKGSCTPDNKKLYDSVQSIERNDKHSEKPIEFLNIIDDIYTYGNKIELFCRNIKKDNWFGWGNEL